MTRMLLLAALAIAALVLPAAALGHPERATEYPDHTQGAVPTERSSGPALYVCKDNSAKRVRRIFKGKGKKMKRLRRQRLRQVKRCAFEHIQAAVDEAETGHRIRILPGRYLEEPSRAVTYNDPKCPNSDTK